MDIFKDSKELQKKIILIKANGKKIGFVPTMGALHEGHLSLIRFSKKNNDITVVSIFVNPKQFGPNEDFKKYPRVHQEDIKMLVKENVDILFLPEEDLFYNIDHLTYVEVEQLSDIHCGKSRPGHFRGVTTVVLKLFNIVQPDQAYFGKKDFQQLVIINKMVDDLSIPVKIIGCPIVRDNDGLALSSRNKYLSIKDREKAIKINESLNLAKELIIKGERSSENIYNIIFNKLNNLESVKIDYISIVDDKNLKPVNIITKNTIILIACFVRNTRLIDNLHCLDFL